MIYKSILFNVSNIEDYHFIRRFYPFFSMKGVRFSYLANNLLIHCLLKSRGEESYLPRKSASRSAPKGNFSVLTNRLNEEESDYVYGAYLDFLERSNASRRWDCVVIPSGRLVSQLAIASYFRMHGVPTIFTGYGNISGKTFVDPWGTDKQSYLFQHPEVLDEYPCDEPAFAKWRTQYLAKKAVDHKIGQARKLNFKTVLKKIVQISFCYVERALAYAGENSYRLSDLKSLKKKTLNIDTSIPSANYIFFPMQVCTDAQIILNYKQRSVIAGLLDALRSASSDNKELVIKPHPAEINQDILRELDALKREHHFYVSDRNTFGLIGGADQVITINSTVGLEAMLVGRPVQFLGDTFYRNLTESRLGAYVMRYLVDIEYFSKDPIPPEIAEDFFSRVKADFPARENKSAA